MNQPLDKATSGYLQDFRLIVTGTDKDGRETFLDAPEPAGRTDPGASERIKFWATSTPPGLPFDIGSAPATTGFPAVGGTTFGITCYPPHSAGKRRFSAQESTQPGFHRLDHSDPTMHRTDSIEYEIIVSGRVDLELSSGEMRTLFPGTLVVMGGVAHSWKNRYDEPCILAVVSVGATPST